MRRLIAFMNLKGGTGKTTLAVHVAARFALSGHRTVLLDMDPQGNAAKCFGISIHPESPSLFEAILEDELSINTTLKETTQENLWLAPSDARMADLTLNISGHQERHTYLRNALEKLEGFDTVLIDSPPSLGLANINILAASQEVVIPSPLTYLGVDGCIQTIRAIVRLQQMGKMCALDTVRLRAILPIMYTGNGYQDRYLSFLQRHFINRISNATVPYEEAIDSAQATGKTVFETNPESRASLSLMAFSNEILALASK